MSPGGQPLPDTELVEQKQRERREQISQRRQHDPAAALLLEEPHVDRADASRDESRHLP